MKKSAFKLLALLLLVSSLAMPFKAMAMPTNHTAITCNPKTTNLKMEQRKLWADHVFWTKNFIISDLASLGDVKAVSERLLKNQDDIGNSIKPYYGEKAGNQLAKLLREHILIAVDVVHAAKSGNKAELNQANKRWYKNADDIALFLSKANPNWSFKPLQKMLHTHLQLLTEDVVARLNKNWQGSVEAFDKGEAHMLMLADTLSEGIIKQFPNKFK